MRFSHLLLPLTCFSASLIASDITISDAEIVNGTSAVFAQNYTNVTMNSGTVTNYGVFGQGAGTISISGGNFSNNTGASLADNAGSITISSTAILINSGSVAETSAFFMSGGTLDNSGDIGHSGYVTITGGSVVLNAGSKLASSGTVNIENIVFENQAGAEIGTDGFIINMTGTDFTNSGSIAYNGIDFNISGGTVLNTGSFAEGLSGQLSLVDGVVGTNSGLIGTVAQMLVGTSTLTSSGTIIAESLRLINATIDNSGQLLVQSGTFDSNEITGTGTLVLFGYPVVSSIPITQNTVYIGTTAGTAFFQSTEDVTADVNIAGAASEFVINNSLTITNLYAEGIVNPGIASFNTLGITGQGTLTGSSKYLADISNNTSSSDRINVAGDFEIELGATLELSFPNNIKSGTNTYTIINCSSGNVVGTFTNVVYPSISGTITVLYDDPQKVQVQTFSTGPGSVSWTGSATDELWLNDGNWLEGSPPSIFDTAIFTPEYQAIGTIALSGGTYTGSPSAALLAFNPYSGDYGTFTFTSGDLYLNGSGAGSELISGGGEQDLSGITLHILNSLSYNINTGGSFSLGTVVSDYASSINPSLIFQGTSTYYLNHTIGEGFALLDFSNTLLNTQPNAIIGTGAGEINLSGASISLVGTKLGENVGAYGLGASADVILNGGTLSLSGATEVGKGVMGTLSVNNLTFTIPGAAKMGESANELLITNATMINNGLLGSSATVVNFLSGSIVNYGNFANNVGTLTISGSFYNAVTAAENADTIIITASLANEGDFGTGATTINASTADIYNQANFGINNPNAEITVNNVQNILGNFGDDAGTITVLGSVYNSGVFGPDAQYIDVTSDVQNISTSTFGVQATVSTAVINVDGNVKNEGSSIFGRYVHEISIGGTVYNEGEFGSQDPFGSITVTGAILNMSSGTIGNGINNFTAGADVTNQGDFMNNLAYTLSVTSDVSITGTVVNSGNFANNIASVSIGGNLENSSVFGQDAISIRVDQNINHTAGTLGYGAGTISVGGDVTNNSVFGGNNSAQIIVVTGSVDNAASFGANAGSITTGNVINTALFGITSSDASISVGNVKNNTSSSQFAMGAGTVSVTGSIYNQGTFSTSAGTIQVTDEVKNEGTFARDVISLTILGIVENAGDMAQNATLTSVGSLTNTQNFAVQSGTSSVGSITVTGFVDNQTGANFAEYAKNITTGIVTNRGTFGCGNTDAIVSIGTVHNLTSGANLAEAVAELHVTGTVYNTGIMGRNAKTITVSSDVTNEDSNFAYQDFTSTNAVLTIGGNVKNLGALSYFAYQAGTIQITGSVYNEGILGSSNLNQFVQIEGSVNNTNQLANQVKSVVFGTTSGMVELINASAAFNNAQENVTFINASITNQAGATLANNGGSVAFTDGVFENQTGAIAFGTVTGSITLTSATITNKASAEFGKGAGEIIVSGGSITNEGSFGQGASIVLTDGAYFENTSVVGQVGPSMFSSKIVKKTPKYDTAHEEILSSFSKDGGLEFVQPLQEAVLSETEQAPLLGQALQTSNYLSSLISGFNAPESTQENYQSALLLPEQDQETAFFQMSPQFKVVQFAQEKLDLLMHKELQKELYQTDDKNRLFVLGGYDNFSQHKQSGYAGYHTNSFYQLIGAIAHYGKMKWLTSLGASESYMKLHPTSSHANYPAVWGSLGLGSSHKNWIYGIDALFNYSFIHTKRKVDFLNQTATSNHGLWSVSFDVKAGYRFSLKRDQIQEKEVGLIFKTKKQVVENKEYMAITPYDIFGYLYGHENNYHEKGTDGNNYQVKNENISAIRNQLGLKIDYFFNTHYTFFVDGAWLYDYYTNNNTYQAAIVGTNVYGNFKQALPTKNYGRVQAGFSGQYKHFDWRVSYTGLYGKYLQDSSVSLRLGYRF